MTFSAFLFLFLSVDEMTGIHERIGDYLGHTNFFPAIEDRYGEWIVLYSGIGALILIFSIKPLLFLFKNYKKEFFIGFLGVSLLLFGAVFMEIASYHFPIRTEATSQLYKLEVSIEEGLEMTGTILLLYCVILLKRNFK